jgi:FeS assembly SUF system regulator
MLRISKLTDYAILMMVELAREGEMLSAHALAERVGVEIPTASKVLKLLSGSGLLESYRGASGGYRVSRPAGDVSVAEVIAAIEGPIAMTECSVEVAEVIAAIEGPIAMTECSVEQGLCSQEDNCELRGNWQRISVAVAQALQEVSLAEMSAPMKITSNPLNITMLNAG